ncbi:carbon-nitrogen hydrolase family protein [Planctomicrobium sp. SH664]|uniref:carbon-nitrogen hydrolase family protein n=1 Tax=Planctomicrobium sp. SH664 TaxID=3448125 RepID=UPI003F5B2184
MKIAVVQMDVRLGDLPHNLQRMLASLHTARANGAELTIFPECALTGYCFDSLEQGRPFAQAVPGPATQQFQQVLAEIGGYALFGLLEENGSSVYNAAALVGGEGLVANYRKVHLPGLGIDRFASEGTEPFAVHEILGVKVGIAICYDSAFPEMIRALALQGADLIALPTNFPTGADGMVDHVLRTRALENKVYFAGCNRVGEEAGFRFIGGSQIVGPSGQLLTEKAGVEETVLYAEIDPALSRDKWVGRPPIEKAVHRFLDRRPEFYGALVEPNRPRS